MSLGLTQKEFAERIGVATNTVARWERGERKPSGVALRMIEMLGSPERASAAEDEIDELVSARSNGG